MDFVDHVAAVNDFTSISSLKFKRKLNKNLSNTSDIQRYQKIMEDGESIKSNPSTLIKEDGRQVEIINVEGNEVGIHSLDTKKAPRLKPIIIENLEGRLEIHAENEKPHP